MLEDYQEVLGDMKANWSLSISTPNINTNWRDGSPKMWEQPLLFKYSGTYSEECDVRVGRRRYDVMRGFDGLIICRADEVTQWMLLADVLEKLE